MFEYSCHEGNYALPNALSFGRKRDASEARRSRRPILGVRMLIADYRLIKVYPVASVRQ